MRITCPYCGNFDAPGGDAPGHVAFTYSVQPGRTDQTGTPICPRCDMTADEHAYRLRILANSTAVYAEEAREFRARRSASA